MRYVLVGALLYGLLRVGRLVGRRHRDTRPAAAVGDFDGVPVRPRDPDTGRLERGWL